MACQIGARLLTVAKFVRQGAYFADIGTDHAYLPLFLLKKGIIERAVLSDINEGPLSTAKRTPCPKDLKTRLSYVLPTVQRDLASSELPILLYAVWAASL